MTQQDNLNNFLESLSTDLNGFIGASIVDLDTGMSLASISKYPDFDLDVAAAYNSEMVKAKFKTMEALGISGGLEDMLLTLTDQLHLIKFLDDNMFVYLAVTSAQSNLALMRKSVLLRIREYDLA